MAVDHNNSSPTLLDQIEEQLGVPIEEAADVYLLEDVVPPA